MSRQSLIPMLIFSLMGQSFSPSEWCHARHFICELILITACPDWLLITVECSRISGITEETVAPRAEQVIGSWLHLIHRHVTSVGNLPLCKRHKLWIPSIKTEALWDKNLQKEERPISDCCQMVSLWSVSESFGVSIPPPPDCRLSRVSQWAERRAVRELWGWCTLCKEEELQYNSHMTLCEYICRTMTMVNLLVLFIIPTWCPCRATIPGWSGCCTCDADTWWMKDQSGELKQLFKVWYCTNYPVHVLYLFLLRPSSPHLLLLPKVGCPPLLPEWGEHRGGGHGEDKGLPRMPRRPRSERKSEEHHNCWTSAVEEDKEC